MNFFFTKMYHRKNCLLKQFFFGTKKDLTIWLSVLCPCVLCFSPHVPSPWPTMCFIRKDSSLCPNPFKGFILRSESFEGCRGPNNCFLKCPSASSSRAYSEAPSSRISAKDHGGPKCPSVVPFKILHSEEPFELPVLSNDPSKWWPWLFFILKCPEVRYIPFGMPRQSPPCWLCSFVSTCLLLIILI